METFNKADYQWPKTWEELGVVNEVRFKASLSGGKGGQNVNKVNSKIELYWNPSLSGILHDELKQRVISKLSSKLSSEGELRLVCEEERSQLKNKEKVIDKFYKLLASCFKEHKKRKKTKPTKASVKKRLDEKGKNKTVKANRKKPDY